MNKKSTKPNRLPMLRPEAEPYLTPATDRPPEELLHELRVQKIELEMQNEELKRSRLALEQAHDLYADLYEYAPVGYLTLSYTGLITKINFTAAKLFGMDRNKLLQHHFSAFVAQQSSDQWYLFFSNALNHNRWQSIELTMKREEGAEFIVQLDCVCVISDSNDYILPITLVDITPMKQAEIDLREAKENIALILTNAEIGTWDWDITSGRVIFNERCAELHGCRLEDLEQHINMWRNNIHSDDFSNYHTALMAYLEKRSSSFRAEYRVRTSSDQWTWISSRGSIVKCDSEGNPLRMTGIEIDITERKRDEEELRIAATAFETQEGIIITDANINIIRVNQAFTRLTGYSSNEAVGQTPRLLKSGYHDQVFYQCLWNTLNDKGFWQGEIWNRHKDGTLLLVWIYISSVYAADGNISHYVASFSDISEEREKEAEIQRLAYYDPLTNLPNRRLFQERLGRALSISDRTGKYGALLFIDLDNFKSINDTAGHDRGDILLIQVAMRLSACIREGDTVARQGGDEFVVMLEALSQNLEEAANQTRIVAEKILKAINQSYQIANCTCYSSSSIGITLFNTNGFTEDDLLKQADIAMYAAKAAGRNTLRFFNTEMQTAVMDRVALESDLRGALDKNQFKLYFQLQADHARQIIGAEILLRWEHPERGMVSPLAFIALAEETRLILPIGRWVLESACAQLKRWEDSIQTRHLQLAVNVSAHQFHEDDFVEQICTALEQHAIQPNRLKLELTESLVLDNVTDTITKMQSLKEIGVHFSMDDFGTGYSSLAYLTQLPLNQLKIDQSFVRNIGIKPTDAIIVQTIIGMANNLGIEVIAEGVETEEQRLFLELNGCPTIQGYLFGKPVPIEQFELLIEEKFHG